MTNSIENGSKGLRKTRQPSMEPLAPVETGTQVKPSELTTCRADKLKRFSLDLSIYSELLLDGGQDIDAIEITTARFHDVFTNASPKRQSKLSNEIIQTIDAKLRGRFFPDLNLLHDLLSEGGQNDQEVGADQRTWRELFEQSPRKDRLQIVRAVREKNETILIQRFDSYLETWRQTLSDNPTISQEEASQQTDKLKKTFGGASKRGKVGLSKQLREKIEANSIGKFTAYLDLYADLLRRNGHHLTPRELPSAEDWIELYNSKQIGEKGTVIDKLQNRISILITAR